MTTTKSRRGDLVKCRQRQALSRASRAEAGGKQIAVMLTPAAAAKLSAWVARGETIAGVVNRLLARSRP